MGVERRPLRLFVSYAHGDEALAKELLKHLKPLERQGLIEPWYDRHIPPGGDWDPHIATELEQADIVLFLLSNDFMNSDYCNGVEVRRALERHAGGETRALPIFLRPVDMEGTPFATIQGLPRDAKAVTEWDNQDKAYMEIAQGIGRLVRELRGEGRVRVLWGTLPGPRARPWRWLSAALLALVLVAAGIYLILPRLLQQAAERAYLHEDWSTALNYNRWALGLDGGTAVGRARTQWLAGLLAEHRGDDAEPHFRQALALAPETPVYRIALAAQRAAKQQDAKVVELLQRLVEDQPELFIAGLYLVQSLRAQGRLDEAGYYQRRAAGLLDQEAAWEREENRGTWYFPTNQGRIEFTSREAKTALLRADGALTLALAGNMQEAETTFDAARTSGVDSLIFDANVLSLLAWRMARLEQAGRLLPQPRLKKFRRRFGVPVWPDRD